MSRIRFRFLISKRPNSGSFGTGPVSAGWVIESFGAGGNFLNSGIDDGATNFTSPGVTSIGFGGDTFKVITTQMNRTIGQMRFFVNRRPDTAVSTNAALIGWNITSSADFSVGNTPSLYEDSRPLTGHIYGILIYRAVITGSKREAVQEYLRKRWIQEDEYSY